MNAVACIPLLKRCLDASAAHSSLIAAHLTCLVIPLHLSVVFDRGTFHGTSDRFRTPAPFRLSARLQRVSISEDTRCQHSEAKSTRAFAGSPQVAPFGTYRCLSCAASIHRIDDLDRCLIVVPFMGTSDHFVFFRFTGKLSFSLYQ